MSSSRSLLWVVVVNTKKGKAKSVEPFSLGGGPTIVPFWGGLVLTEDEPPICDTKPKSVWFGSHENARLHWAAAGSSQAAPGRRPIDSGGP